MLCVAMTGVANRWLILLVRLFLGRHFVLFVRFALPLLVLTGWGYGLDMWWFFL